MKINQRNINKTVTVENILGWLKNNKDIVFFNEDYVTRSCVVAKFCKDTFSADFASVGSTVGLSTDDIIEFKLSKPVQKFIAQVDRATDQQPTSGERVLELISQS